MPANGVLKFLLGSFKLISRSLKLRLESFKIFYFLLSLN